MAIDASDDDDEADIKRYNDKIEMIEYVINMSAYDSYSSTWSFISLTDEAKKSRRNNISECKKKTSEINDKAKVKICKEPAKIGSL